MAEAQDPPPPPSVPLGAFATIWLALFLDLLGFGIIIPVLPYYALSFGASAAVVTLLSTSFSLAQFVMSPVLGGLSDRYGRRPVMLVSIAGSCAAMLALGFATSLWLVFLARLISGACNANVSTANAYVADRVAPQDRARYMGMMGSAIGLGFVFGPAIGGLLSVANHPELPFLVAAGLAAINWVMAWWWLPESRKRQQREPQQTGRTAGTSWRNVARLFHVGGTPMAPVVLVALGFYLAFSAMESTFALLTEARMGWTAKETGYLFSLIGVCIVFSQTVVLSRVVRRFGERTTLSIGLAIQAASLAGVAFAGSVEWFVLCGAGIALGNGLVSPTTSAICSRLSSAEDQGVNQGIVQSASALARIVGPAGAGLLFEYLWDGAPVFIGAVVVVIVLVSFAPQIRLPANQSPA